MKNEEIEDYKLPEKIDHTYDVIYVETLDGIQDPIQRGQWTNRMFFEQHKDAQAIWILPPDRYEPYRLSWKQMFSNRKPQRKGKK